MLRKLVITYYIVCVGHIATIPTIRTYFGENAVRQNKITPNVAKTRYFLHYQLLKFPNKTTQVADGSSGAFECHGWSHAQRPGENLNATNCASFKFNMLIPAAEAFNTG